MQGGPARSAAGARQPDAYLRYGRFGALLLGLAVSACASVEQIANLTEGRRASIAIESIDGPPPAVVQKFVQALKEEAGARRIAVVPPGEADYRLRGYLATDGNGRATSIAWAWDVYGAGQQRALRLRGQDGGAGGSETWSAADEQVLRRIAQTGVAQLAAFVGTARPTPGPTTAETPPARPRSSTFAWVDDWAPEASGIFRIFRRGPQPEIAADEGRDLPSREVPLPRGRPVPVNASSDAMLAFANE
jgi:hypothetical protein